MTKLHFSGLKLLLSLDRNIFSKKWFCDLFLNKSSNISQPQIEHTLSEKTFMQNNFTFQLIKAKQNTIR